MGLTPGAPGLLATLSSLVGASLALVGCEGTQRPPVELPLSVPLGSSDVSVEQAVWSALDSARDWCRAHGENGELFLTDIWVQATPDQIREQAFPVRFGFRQPARAQSDDRYLDFAVAVDLSAREIRRLVVDQGNRHTWKPALLDLPHWRLSATEAFQLAQEHGGHEHEAANPDCVVWLEANAWPIGSTKRGGWSVRYSNDRRQGDHGTLSFILCQDGSVHSQWTTP